MICAGWQAGGRTRCSGSGSGSGLSVLCVPQCQPVVVRGDMAAANLLQQAVVVPTAYCYIDELHDYCT